MRRVGVTLPLVWIALAFSGTGAAPESAPRPMRILDLGALAPHGALGALEPHLAWAADRGWTHVRVQLPAALAPGAEAPDVAPFLAACHAHGLAPVLQLFPEGGPRADHAPDYDRRREVRALRDRIVERIGSAPQATWIISYRGGYALRSPLSNDGTLDVRPALGDQLRLVEAVRRRARGTPLFVEPVLSTTGELEALPDDRAAAVRSAWRALDADVGVVWSGPDVVNRSIGSADLARARTWFGHRPLMLVDRFPDAFSATPHPVALVLAPLRGRDPAVGRELAGYVTRPMGQLGGSRLSLATVAEFLDDPDAYDADAAHERAVRALCGTDAAACDALRTQVLEWGGDPGTHNDARHPNCDERSAVAALRDPALRTRWRYTELRYPERMSRLVGLADGPFRRDLLETMARRLAIARALPSAHTLRRRSGGPAEWDDAVERLRAIRRPLRERPLALASFDRFLRAAGLLRRVVERGGEGGGERGGEGGGEDGDGAPRPHASATSAVGMQARTCSANRPTRIGFVR